MRSIEHVSGIDTETEQRYEFMMDTVQALGERAWRLIRSGRIEMEKKPDGTKVTTADIALNEQFIDEVGVHFPDDLVWGEERSNAAKNDLDAANNNWLWLIDPIDGTSDFWRSYEAGNYSRSTASIMVTGFAPGSTEPTMAVVSNPFQRRSMQISTVGGQIWLRTPHMPRPRLVAPMGTSASPRHLPEVDQYETSWWRGAAPDTRAADRIMPYARRVDHPLSMAGVALRDVAINLFPAPSQPHDVAPGAAIVHNAGGYVRTFDGREYTEVDWRHSPIGGVVTAVNQNLVDEMMERMELARI